MSESAAKDPESVGDGLSEEERALVRVSAAIPARRAEELGEALRRAEAVARQEHLEEVLLQSHLFVGYPVALEALSLWRKVRQDEPRAAVEEDPRVWELRGPRVCSRVYGAQYPTLLENVRSVHPAMARWMVTDGYGKVLGRPGLPLATRELCIAALLAVLEAPDQLYSHLRGALNVGAPPKAVDEALEVARPITSPKGWSGARRVWTRVWQRWLKGSGKGAREGDDEVR